MFSLRQLFLFLIVLANGLGAQAQQSGRISELAKHRIDSVYAKHASVMKKGGIAIAIVDSAGLIYAKGYGFADQENGVPATDTTCFGIGSMTKSFTALSILQLQAQGKLKTDASVKQYLPELTIRNADGSDNQLYIDQLMAHTSGLQGEVLNGFFCDAPPAQSSVISELNQQYCAAPGNYQFAYSNVGYGLLGETIQRVSGMSYGGYLKQQVWSPLGMNATFIDRNDPRHAKAAKTYVGGKMYVDPFIRDEAAGMIRSTALDMSKYVQAMLNAARGKGNNVFSTEIISAMSSDQHKGVLLAPNSYEYWGWGLYSQKIRCKQDSSEATWIGHAGDTFGYHSNMGIVPELGIGVVILMNTPAQSAARSTMSLINEYLKATIGKTYRVKVKEHTVQNERADANYDATVQGVYFIGDSPLCTDAKLRLVGKQGPAKLIFERVHPDSTLYRVKAKLFGFIGIKVKGQLFRFETLQGKVYLKGIDSQMQTEEYLSAKQMPPASIPDTWRSACGSYILTGDYFTCDQCAELNFSKLKEVKLAEKDGFLFFSMSFTNSKETADKYMIPLSNDAAMSTGIGRGTGDTFRLQPDGTLYYSGLVFKKVK